MAITAITDATFEEIALKSPIPVLVDFWATWCYPCKAVAPLLEEMSTQYEGRVQFLKLNTEDNLVTPTKYGIRGLPTLLFLKEGKEVGRISGNIPNIRTELKKNLEVVSRQVDK
ncbi:MAG: thioredoxin [Chloroflexi bacterium]|nr:thioredoxin [Chloroflexota bacterium]